MPPVSSRSANSRSRSRKPVSGSVKVVLRDLMQSSQLAWWALREQYQGIAPPVALRGIVAEELPASARGWGIGMLSAVSAVGHGLGAGVFAAVAIACRGSAAEVGEHGSTDDRAVGQVLLLPEPAKDFRQECSAGVHAVQV